jgi:hypothetical protein
VKEGRRKGKRKEARRKPALPKKHRDDVSNVEVREKGEGIS